MHTDPLWDTPTTAFLIQTVLDCPVTVPVTVQNLKSKPRTVRSRYSTELRELKARAAEGALRPGDLLRQAFRRCYYVSNDPDTLTLQPTEVVNIDPLVLANPTITFGEYAEAYIARNIIGQT